MNQIKIAVALFDWIQSRLVNSVNLEKNEIARFFAPNFIVKANGRRYEATYENYFDFLNNFRSSIESITHQIDQFYEVKETVIITDHVVIIRTDERVQQYEAVVILKFNQEGKVILWEEVYVEIV